MPRLSDVSGTLKWIDSSNLEGNGRKAIESLLCNSHFQLTPEARKSGSRKSTRGTAYGESSICFWMVQFMTSDILVLELLRFYALIVIEILRSNDGLLLSLL